MSLERGPDGRFRRYADDTFMEISNKDIYVAVKDIETRVSRIETHLTGTRRIVALIVPTMTCAAGFVTSWYYLKH